MLIPVWFVSLALYGLISKTLVLMAQPLIAQSAHANFVMQLPLVWNAILDFN